jgi:hypothetical protein
LKIAALVIVVLAVSGPALAQESGTGTFKSQSVSFELGGAIAFRGTSSLNKAEPAIIVAVSNRRLVATLSDFIDRRRAIETLVRNENTAIVYFEFTPEGRYRGLSYYFESGNGCGFCSSEVASTVKLASGRLAGTLKGTEKDRPFNISLDVAVMNDDHGAALPPDGGAPGKAYLAYHAALLKHDAAALRPTLTSGKMEIWDRSKKDGDLAEYVDYIANQHPLTSVRILKAWARADVASVLVEGDGPAGILSGEVLLLLEKGAWVVDVEVLVK